MKFNDFLDDLVNYEAGKPIELVVREFGIDAKDVIKLASNENPFGTSKRVEEALKEGLAKKFGVTSKNLVIGSGSDQIIEYVLHAKANKQSGVLMAGVTFAMYEIYAKQTGAKIYRTKSVEHNLSEFLEIYNAHKDEISVIFLCLPNNPLGECIDADEVYKFIKNIDENTLVVLDCAYNEFAKFKDSKKEIKPSEVVKFKNVIYLGTFSKAYALGGMRVGYGVANEEIIGALSKLRAPFNITTPSLRAAIVALGDDEFVQKTMQNNFEQMKRYEDFARQNGIEFIPSYTNFITFKFNEPKSSQICEKMLKKGIILRDLKSYALNAVRITIGQAWQNDRVFEELKQILK